MENAQVRTGSRWASFVEAIGVAQSKCCRDVGERLISRNGNPARLGVIKLSSGGRLGQRSVFMGGV